MSVLRRQTIKMYPGEKHAMLALKWTFPELCILNNSRRYFLFEIAACGTSLAAVWKLGFAISKTHQPSGLILSDWVTFILCGCRVCSNFNRKRVYGVFLLVILCVSYKFRNNIVSQYSVMVMQCVFCEVGSDFLNINSVNLGLQNCKLMRSGMVLVEEWNVWCFLFVD
jgi:hypothetical protein